MKNHLMVRDKISLFNFDHQCANSLDNSYEYWFDLIFPVLKITEKKSKRKKKTLASQYSFITH